MRQGPAPRLLSRRFTPEEAAEVGTWAYPSPFDLYNSDGPRVFLQSDYRPLYLVDALVGFACFGADARVSGQQPHGGTLDVGAGIRPDLVGRGLGTVLLREVVAQAVREFQPLRLRAAIAEFNQRSQRLCLTAGFQRTRTFTWPGGRPFAEYLLDLAPIVSLQGTDRNGAMSRKKPQSDPQESQIDDDQLDEVGGGWYPLDPDDT